MPLVFIPSLLRDITDGKDEIQIDGFTVAGVVKNLIKQYPGLKDRLLEDGRLRGNLSIAVDGEISPAALLDEVEPDSEIHFVPAISGG